jgi:SAM-dependent methyltransferase
MSVVQRIQRRLYANSIDPIRQFESEAFQLVQAESVVLHAGCGADSSLGFRSAALATIGVDLGSWIWGNSDIDYGIVGNLGRLPLADQTVDLVVSKYVVEHLRHPEGFIRESARVLAPGGYWVMLAPNKWHYFSVVVSLVPLQFQQWIATQVLGWDTEKVFRSFYRANTMNRLRAICAQVGLVEERLEMLEPQPAALQFSLPTYLAGVLYERVVSRFEALRGLRANILAVFRKPM